jgi:hypothetical protein
MVGNIGHPIDNIELLAMVVDFARTYDGANDNHATIYRSSG